MNRSIRTLGPALVALFLFLPPLLADEVILRGGTKVPGVVLDRNEAGVRLLLAKGDEIRIGIADVRGVVLDPDAPDAGKHLRYVEPGRLLKSGGGLEVAVTYLLPEEGGPRVDLISAVHIADPSYFKRVQRLLDAADVVIYEAVKPKDLSAAEFQTAAKREKNPIRDLQQKLAGWLDLSFQLDEIDYARKHFVHGDLTMEEMTEASGEPVPEPGEAAEGGGETPLPPQLKRIAGMIEAVAPMLERTLGKPGPARAQIKRTLAKMLGNANAAALLSAFVPKLSEVLITRRNEVVVERVKEQAARLRKDRRDDASIVVFFGAAHMEGIERSLIDTLDYRRVGAQWLRAWAIPATGKKK